LLTDCALSTIRKEKEVEKEKNYTVRICEDYVLHDPDKVKGILDRVSKIISNSYIRETQNKTHS
jgi:hypothetical protein